MRGRLAALAVASFLTAPVAAVAHSLLLEATPGPNTTVPAPARITLRFNTRVEKRLSRIMLVDGQGARRALVVLVGDGGVDTVAAQAPALAPGRYEVEWEVFSTDGHVVAGRFVFQVAR